MQFAQDDTGLSEICVYFNTTHKEMRKKVHFWCVCILLCLCLCLCLCVCLCVGVYTIPRIVGSSARGGGGGGERLPWKWGAM